MTTIDKTPKASRFSSIELDWMNRVRATLQKNGDSLVCIAPSPDHPNDGSVFVCRVLEKHGCGNLVDRVVRAGYDDVTTSILESHTIAELETI